MDKDKRKARPDDATIIKSFTIERTCHQRHAQLSAGGSVSAVIREIIDLHQVEGIQLLRKEPLIRTSVWVPPEIWGRLPSQDRTGRNHAGKSKSDSSIPRLSQSSRSSSAVTGHSI